MVRDRVLAVAIMAALSIPHPAVLAGVAGDDNQTASDAGSHADKSHSGSLLNDLFAAPVVRDLIARKVVGGLGVAYDFNFVGDLPQLVVFVNHGADNSGVGYLNLAKAELPNTYKGSPVYFRETPVADGIAAAGALSIAQNGKISDREIVQAQAALLHISAMPGIRDLIGRRIITRISVDYTDPPPELSVGTDLSGASSLEDVERQVPSSFEDLPVLVAYGGTLPSGEAGFWGTDPKRPGRARPTDPQ
jgi:hypothetical protein